MRTNSVDMWISAGQSNSEGRATDFASIPAWFDQPTKSCSVVKMYDKGNRTFSNITYGTGSGYKSGAYTTGFNQFGFDLITFRSLANYLGTDVYVVKTAKGATALSSDETNGTWTTDFSNATGYPLLLALLRRNIYAVKRYWEAQGKIVNWRGVVWHQGEGDSFPAGRYVAYQANMEALIDEVRSYTGNQTLPFFMGTVNSGSVQYRAEVRTGMLAIETADANVHVIDTNTFPLGADNVHWYPYSLIEPVGTAYYNRIITELGL